MYTENGGAACVRATWGKRGPARDRDRERKIGPENLEVMDILSVYGLLPENTDHVAVMFYTCNERFRKPCLSAPRPPRPEEMPAKAPFSPERGTVLRTVRNVLIRPSSERRKSLFFCCCEWVQAIS